MTNVIALQACRHGIGCSHLVANLAVILMNHGHRVGLLNTDARIGGLYTIFGLDETSERDVDGYWWLSANAESSTTLSSEFRRYGGFGASSSPGIYLPPVGAYFSFDSEHIKTLKKRYAEERPFEVLHHLSKELAIDFWLIDTQPEMTDDNLMGLSLADITLVLTQIDSYDLQRAAVILEVIHQLEIATTWLVPTLVLPTIETSVVRHMLENTYQQPVAGILHLSEEMMGLASQGIFCLHFPHHALTQTMVAIAQQIEQDLQRVSTPSTRA